MTRAATHNSAEPLLIDAQVVAHRLHCGLNQAREIMHLIGVARLGGGEGTNRRLRVRASDLDAYVASLGRPPTP